MYWIGPGFFREYEQELENQLITDNEIYNEDRPKREQRQVHKTEEFPPKGFVYDAAAGRLRELSLQEKHEQGLVELSPDEKIEAGEIRPKTDTEKLLDGLLTLEQFKRLHYERIDDLYDQTLKQILSKYSEAERTGWNLKYIEAKKWQEADEPTRTNLKTTLSVAEEAKERFGDDDTQIASYIQKIHDKAIAYRQFYSQSTGRKDKAKDLIAAKTGTNLKRLAADIQTLTTNIQFPAIPQIFLN